MLKLKVPYGIYCAKVSIPAGTKKHKYQQIMRSFKIKELWTAEHMKMFITLKAKLIAEPVLSAPVYNGTPFILATDGSKYAFAGVLTQQIKSTLPGGKKVMHLHHIAFASKRTSTSEEKYTNCFYLNLQHSNMPLTNSLTSSAKEEVTCMQL